METAEPTGNLMMDVFTFAALVVGIAKFITFWTPTRADNEALDKALRVLNVVALNVFRDKNADDAP